MTRARIVLLNAALGPLDYRVPEGMAVEPGSIVVAPLGPRQLVGVAWEPERLPSEEIEEQRLRPLVQAFDAPPLPEPLRRLIEWTADYYLAPLASVLRMTLPSTSALQGGRSVTEYRATGAEPERMTPQRAQALERIAGRQGLVSELATAASVSDAVIRGLVKSGAVEAIEVSLDLPYPQADPDHNLPMLEAAQADAAEALADAVRASDFAPFLLDGVTGSGKTGLCVGLLEEAALNQVPALMIDPKGDLTNLLPFLTRFFFYTTGIFFSFDVRFADHPEFVRMMEFQPVYAFLSLSRELLLDSAPLFDVRMQFWPIIICWSLALLVIGVIFFWAAEERYGRVN